MPKLTKKTAGEVNKAQGMGGFEPIPDGKYVVQLRSVEVKDGKDYPYWKWEYEIPNDAEEYSGRRFWNNTSMSPNSLGFLKSTFEAFGVATDTDTDELIGEKVVLTIGTGTVQAGARKGEKTNVVQSVHAYDAELDGAADDDDEDEPF